MRKLFRGVLCRRVAIDADQTTARGERSEDCSRMAATAERGVDIGTVRLDRQRRHGLFEQDGEMNSIVQCGRYSEKPASSGGRLAAGKAIACAVCACHLASSHNSNLWP